MSAEADWPWSVLGLDGPPEDPREVRRAYARLVKAEDWSANVAGFEELRRAYEWAQRLTGEGTSRRRVVSADLFEQEPARPRPTIVPENRLEPSPELARDIPEEEAFHAEAPPQAREDAEADTAQPAEPQPSPWQRDPRQQLWEQLNYQLENRCYDVAALKHALTSPAMDDPDTRGGVERALVNHIAAEDPPSNWITAADDRFNWRQDGVGFRRRFPGRNDAYQNILAAISKPAPPVAPDPIPETSRRWVILISLGLIAGLFRLGSHFALAKLIVLLVIVSIVALMALGMAQVVLNLIVFRLLKLFPWSHRKLNMMLRWWAKPIRGVRKPLILCVSVVLLAVGLSLPGILNMDDRPLPSGLSTAADTDRLYRSLELGRGIDFEDPVDNRMTAVPRFATVLGIEPDEEGLYENGGPALLDLSAAPTPFAGGPAAILRCIAPGHCQLAARQDMEALRILHIGDKAIRAFRAKPILLLETDGDGTVSASWVGTQASRDGYIELMSRQQPAGDERTFQLTLRMFDPSISSSGGVEPFHWPGAVKLPLNSLDDQGVSLSFEWPADQKMAISCVEMGLGGGTRPPADCEIDPNAAQSRETWLCPPQSKAGICASYLDRSSGYEPALLKRIARRVEGNSVSPWPDKTNDLLQKLLKRMTLGGSHPPLPDSPEMRALHAQVLGDYALILDRPSAAKYRTDRDRLRAALARQPQLFEAARAEPEVRNQIWAGFLRNLQDLGFPPPPAEVAQATVSRP